MTPIHIPEQTPLYRALHKERYSRQEFIQKIEDETQRQLVVAVANLQHPGGSIDRTDIMAFGDLLEGKAQVDLDVLLQSPGGDIDIAEKIVYMCRGRAQSLRVIIAESAKSAATLIALAADEIVMGDTSELGPIDPQIVTTTKSGQAISRPALSFLDGLKAIQEEVKKAGGTLSPVYFPLLEQLDPALIDFCKKAIQRAERFAEKWLKTSQCKDDPRKAKQIAHKLVDPKRYLMHGTVIDHTEAHSLGLTVNYLPPHDPLWQAIWRLYCMYESDLRRNKLAKIFESTKVSLSFS